MFFSFLFSNNWQNISLDEGVVSNTCSSSSLILCLHLLFTPLISSIHPPFCSVILWRCESSHLDSHLGSHQAVESQTEHGLFDVYLSVNVLLCIKFCISSVICVLCCFWIWSVGVSSGRVQFWLAASLGKHELEAEGRCDGLHEAFNARYCCRLAVSDWTCGLWRPEGSMKPKLFTIKDSVSISFDAEWQTSDNSAQSEPSCWYTLSALFL